MIYTEEDFKVTPASRKALGVMLSLVIEDMIARKMGQYATRQELQEAGVLVEKEDKIEK